MLTVIVSMSSLKNTDPECQIQLFHTLLLTEDYSKGVCVTYEGCFMANGKYFA